MLTADQIEFWDKGDRPKPDPNDVHEPWEVIDCTCRGLIPGCDTCDGATWVFKNRNTGHMVSDLMADAFDRHG